MRIVTPLLTGAFLMLGAGAAAAADAAAPAQAADLAPPVQITAGGEPIDVEGFAAPFLGDFDGDGKRDLLVGQFGKGRLRIYRNLGTNARPEFAKGEWFTADGQVGCIPSGCYTGFGPQLIDFDGDGRRDILSGAFYGEIYLFRRKPDGTFAAVEILLDKQGKPVTGSQRYNQAVSGCDWDGDGDLDLLVRGMLVPNEGSRREPVFGEARRLSAGGKTLRILQGMMADWDGDGKDDLVASRGSHVVWCRNVGSQGDAKLEAPEVLVPKSTLPAGGERAHDKPPALPPGPTGRLWIHAVDFNDDGRLDLLVGDHYHERILLPDLTEQQKVTLKQAEKKASDLSEALRKLRDAPKGETSQARLERYRKMVRKWQQWTDARSAAYQLRRNAPFVRHGRVWLFERTAEGAKKQGSGEAAGGN